MRLASAGGLTSKTRGHSRGWGGDQRGPPGATNKVTCWESWKDSGSWPGTVGNCDSVGRAGLRRRLFSSRPGRGGAGPRLRPARVSSAALQGGSPRRGGRALRGCSRFPASPDGFFVRSSRLPSRFVLLFRVSEPPPPQSTPVSWVLSERVCSAPLVPRAGGPSPSHFKARSSQAWWRMQAEARGAQTTLDYSKTLSK